MSELEQEIRENAIYFQSNPHGKWQGSTNKFDTWLQAIHNHFNEVLLLDIKRRGEKFVEYWPCYIVWGRDERGDVYGSTAVTIQEGRFGTGYVCVTDKNLYLASFGKLTKQFPRYEERGFLGNVLIGSLTRSIDKMRGEKEDKVWNVPWRSIVAA